MTTTPIPGNGKIDDIDPPVPPASIPNPADDKAHAEDLIDEGSAESFPASDPPASHQFT